MQSEPETVGIRVNMNYQLNPFSYTYDITVESSGETTNVSGVTQQGFKLYFTSKEGSLDVGDLAEVVKVETVPEQISGVFQKKSGGQGELEALLSADGDVVASSSTTQPYGVARVSHVFH